jgi:hypothetical protein
MFKNKKDKTSTAGVYAHGKFVLKAKNAPKVTPGAF